MSKKTNAMRILDSKKIKYRVLEYKVDEEHLDAVSVAKNVDLPACQVFKTLVLKGDKTGVIMSCIPGDAELDLKKLAKISNNKSVELVPQKDVLMLTGYIRGGVSPLGVKKNYPLYIERKALLLTEVSVSAGLRGLQIIVAPNDIAKAHSQALFDEFT